MYMCMCTCMSMYMYMYMYMHMYMHIFDMCMTILMNCSEGGMEYITDLI